MPKDGVCLVSMGYLKSLESHVRMQLLMDHVETEFVQSLVSETLQFAVTRRTELARGFRCIEFMSSSFYLSLDSQLHAKGITAMAEPFTAELEQTWNGLTSRLETLHRVVGALGLVDTELQMKAAKTPSTVSGLLGMVRDRIPKLHTAAEGFDRSLRDLRRALGNPEFSLRTLGSVTVTVCSHCGVNTSNLLTFSRNLIAVKEGA